MPSLYIINPGSAFPNSYGAEFIARGAGISVSHVADLASATVAAMARPFFDVRIVDEAICPADLSLRPDVVALTGKVSQGQRLLQLAQYFRSQGCLVVAGGPFASLAPHRLEGLVDVLVEGELEGLSQQVFGDLARGQARSHYRGGRPDLSLSPLPAWDLYPHAQALTGSLQTSRGCPFECEFCDVIQYLGRRQRFKPVSQVLAELEVLYDLGFRTVLICDDNFTVNRNRAKEVLSAILDWNQGRLQGPVNLITQGSVDMARDSELLDLAARAGLRDVFVGIETPSQGSLIEAHKHQNVGVELLHSLQEIVEHGLMVEAGSVIGFDSDPEEIVEIQRAFWMDSVVPNILISSLTAPESTPLYQRLAQAGRVLPDPHPTSPWWSNIVPLRETVEQRRQQVRSLSAQLYQPDAYARRLESFAQTFSSRLTQPPPRALSQGQAPRFRAVLQGLSHVRRSFPQLWRTVERLALTFPQAAPQLAQSLTFFAQQRLMLDHYP